MAKRGTSQAHVGVPEEVAAIRAAIRACLDQKDDEGRVIGNSKYGIYCFYDYDDEPIYVGQTKEKLRQRISRHLTNQRTDAVAMNVLDPFEVLTIEVYPLWNLAAPSLTEGERQAALNQAEYTVYQKALGRSTFSAVLNEADIAPTELIDLPTPHRCRIVPDGVYEIRKHPDIRMARRAMTVANLARVISERDVSLGLRRTLLTQTQRLQHLAQTRLAEFSGEYPVEQGDETGDVEVFEDEADSEPGEG